MAQGEPPARQQARRPASTRPAATLPTVEQLAAMGDINLRRPLIDPAAQSPAPDVIELPRLLRLTGTIIEPKRSIAVFATGLSGVQLAPLGGVVEGAEVIEIHPDHVLLRFQGRLGRLDLIKPEAADKPETPRITGGTLP